MLNSNPTATEYIKQLLKSNSSWRKTELALLPEKSSYLNIWLASLAAEYLACLST